MQVISFISLQIFFFISLLIHNAVWLDFLFSVFSNRNIWEKVSIIKEIQYCEYKFKAISINFHEYRGDLHKIIIFMSKYFYIVRVQTYSENMCKKYANNMQEIFRKCGNYILILCTTYTLILQYCCHYKWKLYEV